MNEIKTNDRFDRLTNLDISTHYREREFWVMRSSVLAAFSYWVVAQSPYETPDITSPLKAFAKHVEEIIPQKEMPEKFTYESLSKTIHEDIFESIPEIEILNHPDISSGPGYQDRHNNPKPEYDFIDLGALARNVFYMILREHITQD